MTADPPTRWRRRWPCGTGILHSSVLSAGEQVERPSSQCSSTARFLFAPSAHIPLPLLRQPRSNLADADREGLLLPSGVGEHEGAGRGARDADQGGERPGL